MPSFYHQRFVGDWGLLFWVVLGGVSACRGTKEAIPETGLLETGTSDTGGAEETGDTEVPIDRSFDGRYEGSFTASIQIEGVDGAHDVCIGDTVVGVNALETVQVQGVSDCDWQGEMVSMYPDWADPAAHYEGSMGAENTLSGGVNFGPIQDTWEARFTTETELEGGFSGTVEFSESVVINFEAAFAASLASGPETP